MQAYIDVNAPETMPYPPFVPSPEAIEFCKRLAQLVKDGGIWGTTAGIYRFDKKAKTLTRVDDGPPWTSRQTLTDHHKHTCVWSYVGYRVLPEIDWEKAKQSLSGKP